MAVTNSFGLRKWTIIPSSVSYRVGLAFLLGRLTRILVLKLMLPARLVGPETLQPPPLIGKCKFIGFPVISRTFHASLLWSKIEL